MTRIALIGLGGISQSVHLPVLQRRRADVEIAALVELSPRRLQVLGERYGVRERFTSVAAMITAIRETGLAVDAAILATAGTHAEDALALIEAGVRVLAEKPLAYSFQELDELEQGLARADKEPRRWLRVGYMKEHDPAVAAAREVLAGVSPRHVHVEVLHPADASQLAFARLEPPATDVPADVLDVGRAKLEHVVDRAVGRGAPEEQRLLYTNVLLGSIVHDIALTRHLGLGLAEVIQARRWGVDFPGSVTATGITAAGIPWTLAWHFIAAYPEYSERVTVHHGQGSVELHFRTPYVLNAPTALRVQTAGESLEHRAQTCTWPQEEAFDRELIALIGLVNDEDPPGSSLTEARQDLVAAQALWKACAESAGVHADPGSEADVSAK